MSVTKLIVGGFKSIRERTEIPIAPLTFLFGPNSAGKSAVLLAVKTLREKLVEKTGDEHDFSRALRALVQGASGNSHQHPRTGEDDDPLHEPVTLGVEIDTFPASETIGGEEFVVDARNMALELFWQLNGMRVRLELKEALGGAQYVGVVTVDGDELVEFVDAETLDQFRAADAERSEATWAPSKRNMFGTRWGALRVNLDHPFWGSSLLNGKLNELRQLAESSTSPVIRRALHLELDTLRIETPTGVFHASGWSSGRASEGDLRGPLFQDGVVDDGQSADTRGELNRAIALVDSICAAVSFLLLNIKFITGRELDLAQVSGDRRVLQEADTSTEFDATGTVGQGSKIQDYAAWLGVMCAQAADVATEGMATAVAVDDFVNDSLRLDFFPARGYQVKPEVSHIKSTGLLEREPYGINDTERLKVSLFLEDANGRRLDFADVGSGVSYVMPVLVSLWGADRSWIEQPELHLHPAAQCELGDVVIRAFNRGRFSIIETHSEHMLLRVLRRIRKTAAGEAADPELKCHPEAVSVLYFEPLPDGSTSVRQLRVSRGGDFMDRWPGGFFEERSQELFDE